MTKRPIIRVCALALAAAIPLGLAACGKKGELEPVEGATLDDRVYPAPDTVTDGQSDEAAQ